MDKNGFRKSHIWKKVKKERKNRKKIEKIT